MDERERERIGGGKEREGNLCYCFALESLRIPYDDVLKHIILKI